MAQSDIYKLEHHIYKAICLKLKVVCVFEAADFKFQLQHLKWLLLDGEQLLLFLDGFVQNRYYEFSEALIIYFQSN